MRDPLPAGKSDNQVVKGPRPFLIVGIDGVRWDVASADGVAPTLTTLADEGRFSTMWMEVPTISAPGWGSLLTGASHAEHNVRDNSMIGSRLWSYPDVLSLAFFRDIRTRTLASAGWPVLVDPNGLGPVIHPRMDQQKAGLHRVISRDGETLGYRAIDAECSAYTYGALRAGAFDAGFTYCCEVDDAGHVYGALSEQYREALGRTDSYVAKFREALTHRWEAYGEDWVLVVTTDHGHVDEGGHGGDSELERAAWVIAWSPSGNHPEWGETIEPTDLTPLILEARYGAQ